MSSVLTPAVCFFTLGVIAARIGSDLRISATAGQVLALVLCAAIGVKGGIALREEGLGLLLGLTLAAGIVLAHVAGAAAYALGRRVLRLGVADAAALAAHYGSVSVATFAVADAWLRSRGADPEGFMPAVLAIMEAPAILLAFWLAARSGDAGDTSGGLRHALSSGPIVLLIGALAVAALADGEAVASLEPLFVDAFPGLLVLFLLAQGLVVGREAGDLRAIGRRAVVFALTWPLAAGTVGVLVGTAIGLTTGGATLLGVLAASGSYVAAPAAVQLGLPTARLERILPLSLAVTFPFNVLVGVPVLFALAGVVGGTA